MTTIADLQSRHRDLAATVKARTLAADAAAATTRAAADRLRGVTGRALIAEDTHRLLVALADARKVELKARVEDVVSSAVRAVFGAVYGFRFDASVKRSSVAFTPLIVYPGGRTAGLDSVGGGVVDVVAFALRVAVLAMRNPQPRPVLIADEPFKHLSDSYVPNAAAVVRALADRTGLQFIIISHEEALASAAHRVFTVSKPGPHSVVSVADPV